MTEASEWIDEDPLTRREIDDALRDEGLTRSQRRCAVNALEAANLLVFRGDPVDALPRSGSVPPDRYASR